MVSKAFAKSNPSAFADSARIVDGWDFNKLIPCHGEIIQSAGTTNAAKEAWRNAYGNVMDNNKAK